MPNSLIKLEGTGVHKMIRNFTLHLAVVLLIALSLSPLISPQAISAEESCNWNLESGIVNNALVDIWGTGSNDVFTVGWGGNILHYDGSRWTQFDTSQVTGQTFHGVWGSAPGDVYAVGFNGTIIHYNGSHWSNVNVSAVTREDLLHIWGSSANNIFVVGKNGIILTYNGIAWTSMPSSTTKNLNGVWGTSGGNVFAVGDEGTVLHYDGTHWNKTDISHISSYGLSAVWGSAANDVFAVGDFGTILHYDGNSWATMSSPPTDSLYSIWGSSGNDVYTVGFSGEILHYTIASGWENFHDSGQTSYGIWGSSTANVFFVGLHGWILHYNGAQWAQMYIGVTMTKLFGVWGVDSDNVFAVGAGAGLFHYDVDSWNQVEISQLTSADLFHVWGSSANDVFVSGDMGTILHYNGSQWSKMNVNHITTQPLIGIWGTSAGNVFAVGYAGTILHYDGSGWAAMSSQTDRDLISVWGTAANNILASGGHGTILRYDGISWAPMQSGTEVDLEHIWGTSGQNIYITGGYDLFHYNGSAWSKIISATDCLYGVWGSSANDVYITGDWGDVFHYNGIKWSKISCTSTLTADTLFDIWGSSAVDIFAVGDDGAILHYSGTEAAPTVTSVSPNSGNQGQTLDVIITGTNFTGTTSVRFGALGSYVSVNSFLVDNDAQITANITILSYASPGTRNVKVTTPCGSDLLNNGFTVNMAGQQTQTVNTATGTGIATFTTNAGSIYNLRASTTTACGTMIGYSFPQGFFSFTIANITPGSTVTLTITLPSNMPTNTQYWKCINGQWVDVTSILGDNDGDNVLTLTLKDGGPEDADGHADGTITDPGAPTTPVVTPTTPEVMYTRPPSSSPYSPPPLAAVVALPAVIVQSASLSISKVTPGTPVIVDVTLVNKSTVNGALNVKLYVNGQEEASQGVTVNSGSTLPVSFNVSRNQPGTYSVYVGNVSAGSFTVDELADPNIILYVSSALIFIALILGIFFLRKQYRY